MRESMREITKDYKTGKLTKAQAQIAWKKVKLIRIQEYKFFKQNGNKQLSSTQLTQLNQSLMEIYSSP